MLANGGQETDMSDLIGRIQSSPFFANTNPDFVAELASSAVDRIFMPGDLVVNEGDVGNSMFILLNGSADVYVTSLELVPPFCFFFALWGSLSLPLARQKHPSFCWGPNSSQGE